MHRWVPSQEWRGEDAYIIGGGPSLRYFYWDHLRGKNTIGCNSAFLLGHDIVKILLFADIHWWRKIGEKGTESFGGRVVGCSDKRIRKETCPWLLIMDRQDDGLGRDRLAFNSNTGAMAVNLALILGARRVFLLGFDMKLGDGGRANWHDLRCEPPQKTVYSRFIRGFDSLAGALPEVFPGCEVWNVTNDSDLNSFPKVTPEGHFLRQNERKAG